MTTLTDKNGTLHTFENEWEAAKAAETIDLTETTLTVELV